MLSRKPGKSSAGDLQRGRTASRVWAIAHAAARGLGMIEPYGWLYGTSGPGGLCPRVHSNPPPRVIVRLKLRCAFRREATSTLGPDLPHPGKR